LSESRQQTRRIAYGTSTRFAGRALGAVISLVALREATRYFGPVQWGPITAALAWVAVFSFLGTPGVATLTMREIARPGVDAASVFGRALAATLAVSVGAGVAAVVLGLPVYWGRSETVDLVLIMTPGIPLMGLFITSGSVLIGRGRNDARAALDPLSSAFLLVATIVVVETHLHSRGYALAYLGSVVASGLAALGFAIVVVRPKLRGIRRELKGTLRTSLPLGQFDLFAIAYARADSIMLFLIRGDRPVALYGVAYQIANFLFAMPALLSNALLPEFMSADEERREFLARRALDVILTVALPLPLFGALFARPFVIWIAGFAFAGAGPPLAILTGAAAIALVNGYLFQMAVFAGAEKGLWRVIATVTVANLAANAVAVSFWGADGAASVMILSEAIGLAMYWRIYRSRMANPLGRRYPLSVVIALLGTVACCWILHVVLGLVPGAGIATVPRAVAIAAVYAALLWTTTRVARHVALLRRARPASKA
jgi:O-antigen/teichoic acid export membrane protein